MRVGLIADIHGNLLALDAVLAELAAEGVDEIVCLGDVAVGPQTAEALERIAEIPCRTVLGNWDKYVVDGFPSPRSELERKFIEMGEWWSEQLGSEHRDVIRGFEQVVEVALTPATKLLAFHGSPRSLEDGILSTTPDDEVERMLVGFHAPLMVAGHTHFAMARQHGSGLLVNPGSVGLPFSRLAPVMRMLPCTQYAVVSAEDDRFSVELRRSSFDAAALVRLIRETGVPHGEWWADLWTIDPRADGRLC
jgi:predicted phosphodiesterase